jgi:2-oxoglutarate dehydrogenase E2 component (dihydrolipoamide succinyltransferase)
MTRMRQTIARRLKDSQNTAALLTTFNEVDMSNLMALRSKYKDEFLAKHGVKLGFMSAFAKASASAMMAFPDTNAFFDQDNKQIVYRDYVDISVAVGTATGLVTPVVRNVESMSFAEIEGAIGALGKKARDGQITLEDLTGGTFTISNGGVYGSLMGTPILNPPQSAILGMHGIFNRPVAVGNNIEIRPMMYIALTYDHRIIDGGTAVQTLKHIKNCVEDPSRLILDL